MNQPLKAVLTMSAALCVFGATAVAIAQDGPPQVPGGPGFRGQGGGGGRAAQMRADPAMREQMIRQRLAIQPNQEAAFRNFLAATQPPATRPQDQGLTTPQRLDRQLAELQRRVGATKSLYNVLTAEQRQILDNSPGIVGGPGGGRGGPGGPGGRGGRRGGPGGFGQGGGGFGGQGGFAPQPPQQ